AELATYPPGIAFDLRTARALARTAARLGATLVHAHDSHGHTAAVLANSVFGMGLQLVVSRRVDFRVGRFSARAKYGHRSVRRILCVSDAVRAIMAASLRDPSVLRTVRSGIDPARFDLPPDGTLRQLLGLAPDVPLVGAVAALAPHKDLPTFLRTVAALRDAGSTAHGVVVGGGKLLDELLAMRTALGLDGRMHFTGFRDDVPRLLRAFDVFLLTSRTEGLGTSILDAFACDVPVVATRAGGVPEIVHDGSSGLLCAVGDHAGLAEAVLRVLRDPGLRATLTAGGRAVLRAHHPQVVAAATLAEYRAVVAGPEGRGTANTSSA
ncbi:MAG: glycosyltransferase family 4 protein, partial [Flavobacteriales bacterium]|nr:glycosyltransferase family 4 protein [Flavobacteriales bacterium]